MENDTSTPSRRTLLAALAALPVAGLPVLASTAAEPDPIFALIDTAHHAKAASKAVNFESDELSQIEWEAERAVLRARPRSADGTVALLLFAAELAAECDLNTEEIMPVFVNAALTIAGDDASRIVISKQLASVIAGDKLCGEA